MERMIPASVPRIRRKAVWGFRRLALILVWGTSSPLNVLFPDTAATPPLNRALEFGDSTLPGAPATIGGGP